MIEDSFKFRVRSNMKPTPRPDSGQGYMGKVLSVLRNQFGGHSIEKK